MVLIHIAENEEPCAGDQTKYAAHWTVEELREAGLIESFVPAHGGLLFVVPLRGAVRISGMRMRCRGPAAVASGLRAQVEYSRTCDHQPASNRHELRPRKPGDRAQIASHRRARAEYFDLRWCKGYEGRAFEWTAAKDPKIPVRVSGYYLKLTDLLSAEDVSRAIVKPLLDLYNGWATTKLPPLPTWP
jgi:hypothetical protein